MGCMSFPGDADTRQCNLLFLASDKNDAELEWLTATRRDYPQLNIAHGPHDRLLDSLQNPVIVIARAEACHTLAHWSLCNLLSARQYIRAALLVAPSVGTGNTVRYAPGGVLPYLSVVVASRNSPELSYGEMFAQAGRWGSVAIDGGAIGAADGDARLGAWGHGRHALNWLVDQVTHQLPVQTDISPSCSGNVVPITAMSHKTDPKIVWNSR